jgi:hypothetical protein
MTLATKKNIRSKSRLRCGRKHTFAVSEPTGNKTELNKALANILAHLPIDAGGGKTFLFAKNSYHMSSLYEHKV